MTVVNIDDYRATPDQTGPVTITFIGYPFKAPEGADGSLSYSVTVADGDFSTVIEAVREFGGIYIPAADKNGDFWFLPWPPAAVRIRPVSG